jgi:hypothetical protein
MKRHSKTRGHVGQFTEFAELIEKQIRQDLARENENISPTVTFKITSEAPEFHGAAWLLGQLNRSSSAPPNLRNSPYKAFIKVAPPYSLDLDQKISWDFFTSSGATLKPRFSRSELKSAFKQMALKAHPDQGGTPQKFIELKNHFERLAVLT